MVDEIMRGLLTDPIETLDQFVTNEVTNHLFEEPNQSFTGLDLIAINLQRGSVLPSIVHLNASIHVHTSFPMKISDVSVCSIMATQPQTSFLLLSFAFIFGIIIWPLERV